VYQDSDEQQGRRVNRRDTRKWCRGKVGQPHDYKILPASEVWTPPNTPQNIETLKRIRKANKYKLEVCQRCGKRGSFITP
jgi:hypothetical protein